MDITTFPTKSNLINAKSNLRLSKQGYELLDKKRNILIAEMMTMIDKAGQIQSSINTIFGEAYEALKVANITDGIGAVEHVCFSIPEETTVNIKVRSVMGVEIPIVRVDQDDSQPHYSFYRTGFALDSAYEHFKKVKRLIIELAEVENSIYRLATSIKKTQKRANALKNVMIPKYEELVSSISNALEEKDREEFSRLRVIKKMTDK